MWSRLAFVGAFLFLLTDGTAVLSADPPGRVGRLSLVEGTVSLRSPQPVDADNAAENATPELKDEWAPAALNYPVTSGNSLWTESGAKAEIQVGPAEVRLNEQTELEVLRLDDRSVDLALHQGTANIHIGDTMPGGLLIDTPRGPVTLTRPGSYRIDVDTSGDSDNVQVTAFDGEAKVSVETPERTDTHTVARGQSLKLSGEPVQIALADARATAFDDWARSRDPRALAAAPRPVVTGQPAPQGSVSPTVSPVSTQMTGYQDLAPYGSWEPAPNYGPVWYPAAVSPDWAPYRYGHWAYVAPWGWTWIDDAPWGFTPFHYGRWVRVGPRWAWWPGHRTPRPVYAPALVAFVGGNGWSLSIGSGRARPVGWMPLAPYEVYRPHYRTSATYVRNVNITTVNKTVINNITVNKNVEVNKYVNRNAVTAVSADNFTRGRKVNEAKIDVSRKELERAKATNDVRAIKPAAVAVKADQPRPTMHNEGGRKDDNRRVNPAVISREQDRGNQRGDPAIERRNAAIQAAPQDRTQGRTPERNQPREQRRDATPQPAQKPAQQPAQQAAPAAAPQQQPAAEQRQQRERADQQRSQQRSQQDQQRRDQAQQEQRRQRGVQDQQRRGEAEQQQRQQREQQQREQSQRQRQQIERQQAERQQRDAQEHQQRRAQENQRRQQSEVQQRQQAEQQQRQVQEQQRRQQVETQQRQQVERQQRDAQEHQQRQVQENQRRQQAEAQQRQQAEQQQRQQRDQAQQQQQQRQQQEQVRDEQRRRNPEGRPEGKRERAG